jgi:hypothetical protein
LNLQVAVIIIYLWRVVSDPLLDIAALTSKNSCVQLRRNLAGVLMRELS